MGVQEKERAIAINRLVWGGIFFSVAGLIFWKEAGSSELPMMGWFLLVGVWSAICGIGYSISDWIIQERQEAGSK